MADEIVEYSSNSELFAGANIRAVCSLTPSADIYACGFRGLNFIIKNDEDEQTVASILKPKAITQIIPINDAQVIAVVGALCEYWVVSVEENEL